MSNSTYYCDSLENFLKSACHPSFVSAGCCFRSGILKHTTKFDIRKKKEMKKVRIEIYLPGNGMQSTPVIDTMTASIQDVTLAKCSCNRS